ncbi:MAG: adenylate/guanylate cyclase domain-containing protein [Blastocatellia bacterium]|nr:adenylate/guanylate cyclase domain-containing protein [Blastocatellia bacterium]
MRESFNRIFRAMFGHPRHHLLEHRLFNTISLLNAVTNLGGAIVMLSRDQVFLSLLHLGTGVLFLIFYYLSRFRGLYRALYWPFVLLMIGFLFVNAIENAGSLGGAHYYFIPGLLIAIMLSDRARTTILAFALFGAATLGLLYVEKMRPAWIVPLAGPDERFFDVFGNFLFVQIFSGALVMVLARNLNEERRKSDRLLLNILPESVARELKEYDRVRPLQYDCASVMFTDFVGFTRFAENLTPQQLIEELDRCFRHFDKIVKRRNLEKIKTIGDAYMAAAGIPVPNRTHAIDCVLAAIEIQRFMAEMKERKIAEGQPYLQLRLGIHSGKLVAGVIGQEKFAYDVWGDMVNTASRLESSGEAGRINISRATYEMVKDFFECEYRGRVAAKSKGEIDMYFVNRIRPELSLDEEGHAPNERFFELHKRVT